MVDGAGKDSRVPAARTKGVICGTSGLRKVELPMNGLTADAKAYENCFVAFGICIAKVRQKPATLGNQNQQPPAGPMVLFVRLKMLCQVRNAFAENRDLNFRGSRI